MPKIKVIEKSKRRTAVYYREVKSKSSKYKGVYLKKWAKKKKWATKVSLNGKVFHIDSYESEQEAAKAYDLAISKLSQNPYINEESFEELECIKLSNRALKKIETRVNFVKECLNGISSPNTL